MDVDFASESPLDAFARYTGFGANFNERVRIEFPELCDSLTFYRPLNQFQNDVFAISTNFRRPFAIRLNSYDNTIAIWDEFHRVHVELCKAYVDPPEQAIEFIREEFVDGLSMLGSEGDNAG